MAGHNLRGAAANISGLTVVLREAEPGLLPGLLNKLQQVADGLLSTLNQLLSFSQARLQEGLAFEDCDIRALCEKAITEITSARAAQDITVQYALAVPSILYPKVYLHSILYNLLSNACKYRKPGKRLVINVNTRVENGRVALSITDNGTGFDIEKNKDTLFRPNSTYHKGYNSKGLGLFITRSQVEKLGGSISAESEIEKGATFKILF